MPKNDDPKFGKYFNLPNPGLRAYFGHVVQGQSDEYRTNFYKERSVSQILAGWMPQLQSLKDKWPSLLEFENDLAKKVGPMSIMLPLKERIKDIDSYYESILLDSKPISDKAIAAAISDWKQVGRLRMRSQKRTVEVMRKSTNSGSPYFTKRRAVTDKTIPCDVFRKGDEIIQSLDDGRTSWYSAAVLGWRGQEGGPEIDDVKQRVVWMFPYAINIEELRVYQPLIETAQRFGVVPAWISMEAVDERITRLFDTKSPDDNIVCTDFSAFDQHFNRHMQDAAKTCLAALFAPTSEYELWQKQVFPIKYDIPLAYDFGKIRTGAHGMGSGSGGTNADETLTHRCLQYEAAQSHGKMLNPNSMCLGDDGILSYPGITPEDVMQTYMQHGQEMNLSKQYVSKQDCIYLRRWHHRDYRINGVCAGVYSTTRALGRLAEQERYYDDWSKEMVALRQLSILENVKNHPMRDEFAAYCMKGDKYRLGLDIPGFLDHIADEAKKATENMPDFLGYNRALQGDATRGIQDWWIVNYLKSKA